MPSIEGLKLYIRKVYFKSTSPIRKLRLVDQNFSIISNNCWAGSVYQSYGVKNLSPTIGLYIMPDDYIKFISNLKFYLDSPLHFLEATESKYYSILKNDRRFGHFPIGRLLDIEILFLHYKSQDEARDKWNRRCKRINFDKLIFKFNDQNGCTPQNIKDFFELDHKNKIFFGSKQYNNAEIIIPKMSELKGKLMASDEPLGNSRIFNVTNFINDINGD